MQSVTLALLATVASASLDNVVDMYSRAKAIAYPNSTTIDSGPGRWAGGVNMWISQLQEYGCWCFFDQLHGQGRGEPVDGYDDACRKVHWGTTCAKNEILNCDPQTETYSVAMTPGPNPGDVNYDCETLNGGDECKVATCYMESYFTQALLEEAMRHQNVPDYANFKADNGFDVNTCKIPGLGRDYDEFCCGLFDQNTRRPIRVNAGEIKECCNHPAGSFKTYDPTMNKCCAGTVQSLGSC